MQTVEPISIHYNQRCVVCGFAILSQELGGEFDGTYTDYLSNTRGDAHFKFCNECFGSMKEHAAEPPSISIERRRRLDWDNRKQKEEIQSRVDDIAHND